MVAFRELPGLFTIIFAVVDFVISTESNFSTAVTVTIAVPLLTGVMVADLPSYDFEILIHPLSASHVITGLLSPGVTVSQEAVRCFPYPVKYSSGSGRHQPSMRHTG